MRDVAARKPLWRLVAGAALYLPIRIFGPRSWATTVAVTVRVAEQDVGLERLALVGAQAVDDQRLALADAVLLAAETDDRVVHNVENAAGEAREPQAEPASAPV